MALVDHIGNVSPAARFPFEEGNLVENTENLVGINRSQCQIVIRIAAVIKMKTPQHVFAQQPGDDLFDILGLVVMARVNQDLGLRPRRTSQQQRHPPVRNVSVIKGRLEWLIFQQQALLRRKMSMTLPQAFLEALAPISHMGCARIIGTVRKPQRDVSATYLLANFDALEDMVQSGSPNVRVWVPQRAVLVDLVLEYVWINRADPDTVLSRQRPHLCHTLETRWEIPKNVNRHRRAASRDTMHLPCIAKFLAGRGRCGRLYKLAESGPRVGKSPRRQFNLK